MATHIFLNGKEITNPAAKFGIAFTAILFNALVMAVVVFVILPFIGIVVTVSVGFVAIVVVAFLVGFMVLVLGAALFGWLFGPVEFRIDRLRGGNM